MIKALANQQLSNSSVAVDEMTRQGPSLDDLSSPPAWTPGPPDTVMPSSTAPKVKLYCILVLNILNWTLAAVCMTTTICREAKGRLSPRAFDAAAATLTI